MNDKELVEVLDEFARACGYNNFKEIEIERGEDSDSISEFKVLASISYKQGKKR